MDISRFSHRQMRVVAHGVTDKTACFAGGSIRSGKTTAICYGFGIWILEHGMGYHHAIVGQSLETIMRNIGWDFMDLLAQLGVNAKLDRSLGTRIVIKNMGKVANIWIIGAGDERAQKRLLGSTLKGLVIEELLQLPESFFNVAWGRLSVEGAKMWASYNPEGPRHWVKQKIIDRALNFNGTLVDGFRMSDNPALTEEVMERYDASYIGHWHSRMILGEWAGASGLILPVWHPIAEAIEGRSVISLDWGVASVFHALGFHTRSTRANCLGELVYDGRSAGPRTEAEHLEALVAWGTELLGPLAGVLVYGDPSTPASFKRLIREAGLNWRDADNRVIPGLVTTATRLANGDVRIGDCPVLIEELGTYSWDDKKADKGDDAPVKANDHGVDALRYYTYSTGKALNLAELPTVGRALNWS